MNYLSADFKTAGNCLVECDFPGAVTVFQCGADVFIGVSFTGQGSQSLMGVK